MRRHFSQRYFGREQLDARLRAGLVGHWIGNGSGLTLPDVSGYGNHGALTSGPSWTLGNTNEYALQFGPTQKYVVCKTGPILAGLANWSIAAWIMTPTSFANAGSSIYSERGSSGNDILKLDSMDPLAPHSAMITYRNDAGTLTQVRGTAVIDDGEWHHVVGILNAGTFYLFVDGKQDNSGARGGDDTLTDATIQSWIGSDFGDSNSFWLGRIANLRIYNRALNTAEIALLYSPSFLTVVPMGRRRLLRPPMVDFSNLEPDCTEESWETVPY